MEALTRQTQNGSPATALTRDQAEALFDEADEDRSGFLDIDEFAEKWDDMNATYGMHRGMVPRSKSRVSLVAATVSSAVSSVVGGGSKAKEGGGSKANPGTKPKSSKRV